MRRKPSQARARETVKAILQAAAQLLVEIGYARASTNLIAERAGVSIGSLYQYFPEKDAIFMELLEEHRQEMQPVRVKAMEELAAGELPVRTIIARAMRRSLEVRDRDPEYQGVLDMELAGLIARHLREDWEHEVSHGAKLMVSLMSARPDARADLAAERSWILNAVLEEICRRLVHDPLPNLARERVVELTVAMLDDMLRIDLATRPGVADFGPEESR